MGGGVKIMYFWQTARMLNHIFCLAAFKIYYWGFTFWQAVRITQCEIILADCQNAESTEHSTIENTKQGRFHNLVTNNPRHKRVNTVEMISTVQYLSSYQVYFSSCGVGQCNIHI